MTTIYDHDMTQPPDSAPLAYLAGPLFDEGERWQMEQLDELVASCGWRTFLPHRDNPPKTADNVPEIFANDRGGIDDCSLVVANLNGVTTDDGTAWELGYAYAKGKTLVGFHTDWRTRFPDEIVNLMIQCSLDHLVRSLAELQATVTKIRSGH